MTSVLSQPETHWEFVGYHSSSHVQAEKALQKQGSAYEWNIRAVDDNRAASVGQPGLFAPEPHCCDPANPEEAFKVLNRAHGRLSTDVYQVFVHVL